MNDYLVSIIIPVYNTEKYLEKCLQSIEQQDYKNTEVILVDDGSTDSSGLICDQYADQHENFHVLHQQNSGQASARNNAVKTATGDFIAFVDSDDFVTNDYISYLVRLQVKYHTDVVIARGTYYYENQTIPTHKDEYTDCILTAEEALIRLNYNQGMTATPWSKLYRRELILKHPFPTGQIYEDLATIYKIIGDCDQIAYSRHRIYFWTQREGSTMRTIFGGRQMAAFQATRDQLRYMEQRYPSVVPSVKARHMTKIVELMPYAMKSTNARNAYITLRKEMLYYPEVIRDSNIRKTQRFRLRVVKMGYYPTRIITSLHERIKKAIIQ